MMEIIDRWKYDMLTILKVKYPKASSETLDNILNDIIKENMKIEEMSLYNSYTNMEFSTDSLQLTEFYFKKKPLTAGNGILFDPDGLNPSIPMLQKQKKKRKEYKNEMYKYAEKSFEFMMGNLKQNNEKTKMNAWYGINGTKTSLFFNIDCATGITGKGRHLISTATCAFEAFIGDNYIFLDMDDCLMFIKNVLNEKADRNFDDNIILDNNVSRERLIIRLRDNMDNPMDFNEDLIRGMVYNMNIEDVNRLYYKNNLFDFCRNQYIRKMWDKILLSTHDYRTLDKTPEDIKHDLDIMWDYIKEYVLYNYQFKEKYYRVTTKKRKVVLVIDTDSNMIYLDRWVDFIKDDVISESTLKEKESTAINFEYDIVFTFCYIVGYMIKDVLVKYLKQCNVKSKNIDLLDMKNEYLFSRMVITDGKKAYASIIDYKEGKDMHGTMDVKGLQIHKSDTNKNASNIFQNILEYDILKSDKININEILVKISEFEKEIKRSINAGESTYLKPAYVKREEAYADPLSEQGIRAVMNYNVVYPDRKISLPSDFFIVKTTLLKPSDLTRINDRDIAKRINDNIFESDVKKIKTKGLYVFALPKDEDIPEWLIPFVDIKTMTSDIIKAFLPVLKALGPSVVSSNASTSEISNYISL